MAGTNERFIFPEQVWYDATSPGSLHDDLRRDYARTRAHAIKRPSLRRHMDGCTVCQAIAGAAAPAAPPAAARRRLKIVLTRERLHQLLALPVNCEIVHAFAENDPNVVYVLIAGEGLPPMVNPDGPTPVGVLDDPGDPGDVAEATAPGAS
jgi:hypothetical protein